MKDSTIHDQAAAVIDAIGCSTAYADNLRAAWRRLAAFLEDEGTLPLRIEGIPQAALHRFASHCRSEHASTASLTGTLGALRMLLKHAGHRPRSLTALFAPTKRKRVRNRDDGKYVFVDQTVEVSPPSEGPGSAVDMDPPSV